MTQTQNGVFIVIEGSDGSGKGTQFKLLADHLKERGYDVATFDFPQYDQPSAHFVKKYLNGGYGTAEDVGPYTSSLFYALDRFEAAPAIRKALEEGKIVLSNRFTGSSMGHQGTKFVHAEERRGYFIWLDNLEFEMLKIPRPDVSLVLRVPAKVSLKLIDDRGNAKDEHENLEHLQRAVAVFDDMCQLFPKDFQQIDCVRGGELLPIETVHELVRQKLEPMLPPPPKLPQQSEEVEKMQEKQTASASEVAKQASVVTGVIPSTTEQPQGIVTNDSDNVYSFTDQLDQSTIAAALAQFSHNEGDLRTTILSELMAADDKDKQLMQQKLPLGKMAYTKQLNSRHVVVENASSLLIKKLEWGRLASYLEQSDHALSYDQKGAGGSYKYFVPNHLATDIKTAYCAHLDEIFRLYGNIVESLSSHLAENSATPAVERDDSWQAAIRTKARETARSVLPVAATASVGIFASGQALENLVLRLLSDPLPEARKAGEDVLSEIRKVDSSFLEYGDGSEQNNAWIAYHQSTDLVVKNLADKFLPENHAAEAEPVQLASVWPRNEFDILPDMLYEHSNLPLQKIREEVITWPYEKRLSVFEAYIGERSSRNQKPGRALEKIHYSWDIICEYAVFRDLQRHRMVDDLEWQELTPRYGYSTPKLIEEAGLEEEFQTCFDISLKLHSLLQANGYALESQYATLMGHKLRWKVTYNAREAFYLHELRTTQGHPATRKVVQKMHEKLSEVHPLLGESMKFVQTNG